MAPASRTLLLALAGAFVLGPHALHAQVQIRGRLLTEAGQPIPGATILVGGIGYSVRSDSSGRFALAGARGATLQLYFTAQGFRRDSASVVLGRGVLERDFTLTNASVAAAESNPSATTVRGLVVEENGVPLSFANVQVNGGTRFVADDSGRFQFPYEEGSRTLLVRRIGFEPAELKLTAKPDTALRIVLKPVAVQLKEVTVVASRAAYLSLDIHGFYRRMRDAERGTANGWFVTPEDIERRKPNWSSQMAEGLPTVKVSRNPMDPTQAVIQGSQNCRMTVYVDNIRIGNGARGQLDFADQLVLPTSMAAMEIYPRAVAAPPQYPSVNGTCGVVLIWTK